MVGMSFGKHPWNTNMKPKRQDDFPSHFGVVAPGFVGCQSWGSVSFFLLIRKPWDSETHVWIKVHQYTKSLMYTFPCVLQKILLPKFAKKTGKKSEQTTTHDPPTVAWLVSSFDPSSSQPASRQHWLLPYPRSASCHLREVPHAMREKKFPGNKKCGKNSGGRKILKTFQAFAWWIFLLNGGEGSGIGMLRTSIK